MGKGQEGHAEREHSIRPRAVVGRGTSWSTIHFIFSIEIDFLRPSGVMQTSFSEIVKLGLGVLPQYGNEVRHCRIDDAVAAAVGMLVFLGTASLQISVVMLFAFSLVHS